VRVSHQDCLALFLISDRKMILELKGLMKHPISCAILAVLSPLPEARVFEISLRTSSALVLQCRATKPAPNSLPWNGSREYC